MFALFCHENILKPVQLFNMSYWEIHMATLSHEIRNVGKSLPTPWKIMLPLCILFQIYSFCITSFDMADTNQKTSQNACGHGIC